ncbi:metallophosphoesterase [Conexibacter sp. SYSU D00693]|uniref:metallophosphoesterase family protein n=1 Tax=Conexibacter sp. SYSU D00693 TaxID=2812560 RepID=UPI00196A45E4|nr:metallophosphoesterase [Conexibacter sp. SYSU D00693]
MDDGACPTIKVAAAGDLHCSPAREEEAHQVVAGIDRDADVVLLAGDLTTHGEPEQAAVCARACAAEAPAPVYAVLGNHDHHTARGDEVVAALQEGGITVVDRGSAVLQVGSCEVGIAGAKGLVGGFPGSHLPDFGEPVMRAVYAECGEEVDALRQALQDIAVCSLRLVLLHYAPTGDTLVGEPEGIWTFLGTDRLAAPILEHEPDLVVHGHAHAGSFEGAIGNVPVHNVSLPVLGGAFHTFELQPSAGAATGVH